MIEKILFIYNPKAGKGEIDSILPSLISYYTSKNVLFTIYPTKAKGDGGEFLSTIDLSWFDKIVVSGGDGTFSEIATTLVKLDCNIPLGYIPLGSTNDFGRSSNLPKDVFKAADITLNGRVVKRDLGKLNDDSLFVYVAAFGLFTNVTYTTSQSLKNSLGYFAYILEGAKSLFPIKTYKLKIKTERAEVEGEFIAGIISNSYYVGGRATIENSFALLDDGKFEILLIHKPKDLNGYMETATSLLNGNLNEKYMTFLQASSILIEGDEVSWNLDGEEGRKEEKTKIEVENKKLNLITVKDDEFLLHL